MLEYDPNKSYELIPEGEYLLQIREEPEARRQTSASGNEYIMYIFKFTATHEQSGYTRKYNDIFVHWNPLFKDLLLACGGTEGEDGKIHLSETEIVGKQFKAKVGHVPNPNKPDEMRAKIISIEESNDVPPPSQGKDDDVPF